MLQHRRLKRAVKRTGTPAVHRVARVVIHYPSLRPLCISAGARGGGGVSGGGGGVRGGGGNGVGGGGGTGTASWVSAVGKKGRWGVITAPRF